MVRVGANENPIETQGVASEFPAVVLATGVSASRVMFERRESRSDGSGRVGAT